MGLADLGWDEGFATEFASWAETPDICPARVTIVLNHNYRVHTGEAEVWTTVAGRVKHRAHSRSELPVVGDWVAMRTRPNTDRGAIVGVLPRRSRFSRKVAGSVTNEQVVAANVDVVFLVMALDADLSLRRLERYLLLARESGSSPVVLLTKPDLCADVPARTAEVAALDDRLPVHVLNPKAGEGLDDVSGYLPAGRTGALMGSSGVGKSTIINRLVGEEVQKTGEVRKADSKGRHITTHRQLVVLPTGGLIIDTPGMRELQLWDVGDAVQETFEDIEALAAGCRFGDCRHRDEPGCAVKEAAATGRFSRGRLDSYLKLQDELAALAGQREVRARLDEKRRSKIASRALRQHLKTKRR
jgi:ribosome biogenesis GTPase